MGRVLNLGFLLCCLLASCGGGRSSGGKRSSGGAGGRRAALQRACRQARSRGDQPILRRSSRLFVRPEGAVFDLNSFIGHTSNNSLVSGLQFFIDQEPPGFYTRLVGNRLSLMPRPGQAAVGGQLQIEARDQCGISTPITFQVAASDLVTVGYGSTFNEQIFNGTAPETIQTPVAIQLTSEEKDSATPPPDEPTHALP